MDRLTGLVTADGKEILTAEYIESLRENEGRRKKSNYFIAQKGAQEADLHVNVDILVTGGNRGGGKANTVETLVVTPDGYKRIGDLVLGDKICTPYNGVQRVKGIYDHPESVVYRFSFDDGTHVDVMDNHRFMARTADSDTFKEMTAREIMKFYKLNHEPPFSLRRGVDYIEFPLCGEVEMNEEIRDFQLPIHPLVLGAAVAKGTIWFSNRGLKMNRVRSGTIQARELGYITPLDKQGNVFLRGFTTEQRRFFTTKLTETAFSVPDLYMHASVAARWAFVRGVWGANGEIRKSRPYFAAPNKTFVLQLAEIMRSLGGWVRTSEILDDYNRIGWWQLIAVMPDDKMLFANTNAANSVFTNGAIPKTCNTSGILSKKLWSISRLSKKKDCRCIEVTGRDHLYMTEHFTVNHNTVTMLMKPLYDIDNKHFNGIILRRNKDDFENIVNESARWFGDMGRYNKSKDDMTWNFNSGAKLKLSTYDMPYADFDTRYRGQQFAYIGIDELPQMPFEYFKFLMTSSRNSIGVRSQILGTCNPDPLSWLRRFLDWWIGKEDTIYSDGKMHPERKGLIIPERDGVVRYCYMPDDNVANIVWGDTPDEVYDQCRDVIDSAWDSSLEEYGYDRKTFAIKSVTFIKASLYDNKALLKNDPAYIANLLNQPPEIRMREFEGNWDVVKMGTDMVQAYHLDQCFHNSQQLGDGIRRASCDVAGTGGDNCVTWLWIGWHVADVYVCRRDPYSTTALLKAKLQEWGVLEENFTYDLNGMGQVLKGAFPRAMPFNNLEAVPPKFKHMYDNIKSMSAYQFAEKTMQSEWSIEPSLLDLTFQVGKNTMRLYNILQVERKAIKQDMSRADKGWCLIHKEQMKHHNLVGHSPDFIEALFERMIFEIKHKQMDIPSWLKSEATQRNGGRIVRRFGFSNKKSH